MKKIILTLICFSLVLACLTFSAAEITFAAAKDSANAAAESPQRRSKTMRAGVLIKALDDLLAKCLLTEEEISRLPDTGDLGVVSARLVPQ